MERWYVMELSGKNLLSVLYQTVSCFGKSLQQNQNENINYYMYD